MDVSSVSSSQYSALAASAEAQSRRLPADREPSAPAVSESSRQAEQAQGAEPRPDAEQARRAQSVNESEAAAQARAEAQRARPTVNTNGQTVGTRVNTTA